LLLNRMRHAVEIERRHLRRFDHIANRDVIRRFGEGIPTVRATRAANDVGTAEAEQNLLDVVHGQPLDLGDLATRDRAVRLATGEMERTDDAVFSESSNAHDTAIYAS